MQGGEAILLTIGTVLAMEAIAWFGHKYIMHGIGWAWHRDHHVPTGRRIQKNDRFVLIGAAISMIFFAIGSTALMGKNAWAPGTWIGVGMLIYGVLYTLAHDGLVHQRWFRHVPRDGYLKRLIQAHKLHHSTISREGGVSFGFLWAEDAGALREKLAHQRRNGAVRIRRQARSDQSVQ